MRGERSLISFIEMPTFTRSRVGILSDEELDRVQAELQVNPEAGDVIQGTFGVRKIRVAHGGKGKRGGARVLYYYVDARMTIYLMRVYAKSKQVDVSPGEKRALRMVVDAILGESHV
jgi:hypothetical protein